MNKFVEGDIVRAMNGIHPIDGLKGQTARVINPYYNTVGDRNVITVEWLSPKYQQSPKTLVYEDRF